MPIFFVQGAASRCLGPFVSCRFAHHHQTGDEWCIYPMYDFTHCISDALEGITHSICTLEFEGNRPLYEYVWQRASCLRVSRDSQRAVLSIGLVRMLALGQVVLILEHMRGVYISSRVQCVGNGMKLAQL